MTSEEQEQILNYYYYIEGKARATLKATGWTEHLERLLIEGTMLQNALEWDATEDTVKLALELVKGK